LIEWSSFRLPLYNGQGGNYPLINALVATELSMSIGWSEMGFGDTSHKPTSGPE
jgi:hypothetical protein